MKDANRKIAFFGTRPLGSTCLQWLLHVPRVSVVAVLTLPKGYEGWWRGTVPEVYEIAKKYRIPVLKSEEDLLRYEVDLGISVQHTRLVSSRVMSHPRNGFINLHNAPLPYYRGRNAFAHVILNGEKRFGASIHYMGEKIDQGPIIKTKWFQLSSSMTAKDISEKTEGVAFQLFKEVFPRFLRTGRLQATPQTTIINAKRISPRYYSKDSLRDLREIDLSWEPKKIFDHVRALEFPPFSPAFFTYGGKKIYLTTKNPYEEDRKK